LVGGGAVGSALVALPVDGIFFTGSHATGKRIAEAAAGRMLQLQLELGGKDPIYVCGDVDVEKVAPGVADGAFYNAGQGCCSVERVYVERPIYDAFVAAFVAEVKSWKQGDPTEEGTYLGPMTRKAQLSFLEAQVQDAVAKGARLLCGGKRVEGTGYYFEPTVLVDVDHTMSVMRDESFGPIIGIAPVDSDAEAIAKMNDTDYGLTAGVYTPDLARAEPILAALHVGSAYWNCCDRVSPRLPWSGRQASGVGLTLSTHGIRAFTRPKALHLRRA
jgi:acyl-CoA reductase-like NAD-dependent aldehyde dehydrogenase